MSDEPTGTPFWSIYDWHPQPELRILISSVVERLQQAWGRQFDSLNFNTEWRDVPRVFKTPTSAQSPEEQR